MKLIVISKPTAAINEHELINGLMGEGLAYFHLRKPEMTIDEMEHFLHGIKPQYYRNIIIHSNFGLIEKYNLKGIHFPQHYLQHAPQALVQQIVKTARAKRLCISTSAHSTAEIERHQVNFDYVFLSPIFDSISKVGYKGSFDFVSLRNFLKAWKAKQHKQIIALGGIDENNMDDAVEMGFDGVAILGCIWNAFEKDGGKTQNALTKYKRLVQQLGEANKKANG